MSVVERTQRIAVQAAQSLEAAAAAAMLEDALGVSAFAQAHGLTGPFGLAAMRRALEVRSGRPQSRTHASPDAPRFLCPHCGEKHPAKWRAADRTWVLQHCDKRRWTLDYIPPDAEMTPAAVAEGVVQLRRYAWAYQDLAKRDVEAVRRVLFALDRRAEWLRTILVALRDAGAPDQVVAGIAAETCIELPRRTP